MSKVTSEWDDGVLNGKSPESRGKAAFTRCADLRRTYLEQKEACATHLQVSAFHIVFSGFKMIALCGRCPSRSGVEKKLTAAGMWLFFLLGNVTFRQQPRARSQISTAATGSELDGQFTERNHPAGSADDECRSADVSDALWLNGSPLHWRQFVLPDCKPKPPPTDAHHPPDATLQFWPRPNTEKPSRCVFAPAAPPSCPAASRPASDSCVPPLRSSPASSTRRPRCATSLRLSNSNDSSPPSLIMQPPADVPDPHVGDPLNILFFRGKFIRGLKVCPQDQRVKTSEADASAFSAGWLLRAQWQIWLRAVDRWVLAGQQFTHPQPPTQTKVLSQRSSLNQTKVPKARKTQPGH